MADTQRTLSELLTQLFADGQAAGSISAQDIRDLIVSFAPSHGSISVTAPAVTPISAQNVFAKMAGSTGLRASAAGFDMPADNRLRYTGVAPRHLHIACTISVSAASSNKYAGFKIYHYSDMLGSGAFLEDSLCRLKVGTSGDIVSTALHADVMVMPNDYIELWGANLTDDSDLTLQTLYMFALGVID